MPNKNDATYFFRLIIAACDKGNYSSMSKTVEELRSRLDCRYIASEREDEFLRYCSNLIEKQEYQELKRLLTLKIKKNEEGMGNNTSVLKLSSYRNAI